MLRYNKNTLELDGAFPHPLAFEDRARPNVTISLIRRCVAAAERNGCPLLDAGKGDAQGQSLAARMWQGYNTLLQRGNAGR